MTIEDSKLDFNKLLAKKKQYKVEIKTKFKRVPRLSKESLDSEIKITLAKISIDSEILNQLLISIDLEKQSATKLKFIKHLSNCPIEVVKKTIKFYQEIENDIDIEKYTKRWVFKTILQKANYFHNNKFVSSFNIYRQNGDTLRDEVYNLVKGLLK